MKRLQTPQTNLQTNRVGALLCLCFVGVCLWASGTAHADLPDPESERAAVEQMKVMETASPVAFGDQSAMLVEMGLGLGRVGRQFDEVLDAGGVNVSMSLGWRMGYLSLELPFQVQAIQAAVLSNVSLLSVGLRSRLSVPIWDGGVRLSAGLGFYGSWLTTCEEGETSDDGEVCERDGQEVEAFADYSGRSWEASGGVAMVLFSTWDDCSSCGCGASTCMAGGAEILLSVEYRRFWYGLENDTLSRSLNGTVDVWMVSLITEGIFELED